MEVIAFTEQLEVGHEADVGAVRRRFAQLAGDTAAIIGSELASNILKHARHGGVLLGDRAIAAWDRGPGMDIAASLRDGVSTAGTAGNGLGAVARLATHWDAYATRGTVVTASLAPPTRVGGVCLPYPGETVCGDGWRVDGDALIVVDGLGHGQHAHAAARAVLDAFRGDEPPARALERAHRAAGHTRGAACTIVQLDRAAGTARIAGVGNVAAWIWADRVKQVVTQHGTLGQVMPHAREEAVPFPAGALLVVASDGLKSRWSGDDYPGLQGRAPACIATVLWRDLVRGRDDATCVVMR